MIEKKENDENDWRNIKSEEFTLLSVFPQVFSIISISRVSLKSIQQWEMWLQTDTLYAS